MRIEGSSVGGWERSWVLVDGERLEPGPSLRIRNHSPTGFSWGYGGSGPSQLALAILLAAGLDSDHTETWPGGTAERLYHRFKDEFIAPLRDEDGPLDHFEIEVDIDAWLARQLVRESS